MTWRAGAGWSAPARGGRGRGAGGARGADRGVRGERVCGNEQLCQEHWADDVHHGPAGGARARRSVGRSRGGGEGGEAHMAEKPSALMTVACSCVCALPAFSIRQSICEPRQ